MGKKKKKPPKLKNKFTVKINLLFLSFEWSIEIGG
nr:MAG TPA: hypothetical protein [Caudoviricetes sp.]DAS21907.1 MAG TPA: hypothetical protein [Caudoviricetes sp.]